MQNKILELIKTSNMEIIETLAIIVAIIVTSLLLTYICLFLFLCACLLVAKVVGRLLIKDVLMFRLECFLEDRIYNLVNIYSNLKK